LQTRTIFTAITIATTLTLSVSIPGVALAQTPAAAISGPIASDRPGDPARNFSFNASAIDLTAHGYIEEELFIQGTANRYVAEGLATGEVVDTGHPYRTRLVVRRHDRA